MRLLYSGRKWLRQWPGLWKLGRLLGLNQIGRYLYDRSVISQGRVTTHFMGQTLNFEIASSREVHRLESLGGEDDFISRILASVRPGDVFFDVGANIGIISLLVAGREVPNVTAHAFEPEPRNAEHLLKNIQLNQKDTTITAHRLALGNRQGEAALFIEGEVGSGTHSLAAGGNTSSSTVTVKLDTADALCKRINVVPTVFKIDVEGAEMDVLEGMNHLLRNHDVRELFIEVHPEKLAASGRRDGDVVQYLKERNYKLAWSADRGHEQHHHYQRLTSGT